MSITTIPGTELTPKLMAQAFWELASDEQALFFAELNKVVKNEFATNPRSNAWSLGERQWFYVSDEMAKNTPAREMLMAMAAPLYMHALRAIEGQS